MVTKDDSANNNSDNTGIAAFVGSDSESILLDELKPLRDSVESLLLTRAMPTGEMETLQMLAAVTELYHDGLVALIKQVDLSSDDAIFSASPDNSPAKKLTTEEATKVTALHLESKEPITRGIQRSRDSLWRILGQLRQNWK